MVTESGHGARGRGRVPLAASNVLLAVSVLLSNLPAAQAAECFRAPRPSIVGTEPAGTAVPVTLETTFEVQQDCEYFTDRTADRHVRLASHRVDLAELLSLLGPAALSAHGPLPVTVYACRGARCTAHDLRTRRVETLFADPCVTELLADRGILRMQAPFATGALIASAPAATRCGASGTELSFVATDNAAPLCELPSCGTDPLALGAGQEISIPGSAAVWTVYGRRVGSTAGIRLGTVPGRTRPTPLQAAFAPVSPSPVPWLTRSWERGALELHRAHALDDVAFSELVTAATAGEAWVVHRPRESSVTVERLGALSAYPSGETLRLPDGITREYMQRRYGVAASAIVPTRSEWDAILGEVSICLVPRYRDRTEPTADSLLRGSLCKPFAEIVAEPTTAGDGPPRVCVTGRLRLLTSDAPGVRAGDALEPRCIATPDARGDSILFATVGDELDAQESATDLYACDDGEAPCVAVRGRYRFPTAGLFDVRRADSPDHARRVQGLALVHIVVIAPEHDWLPTGLQGEAPHGTPRHAWAALPRVESAVFAYVRGQSALTTQVRTTPAGAAVVNAPALSPRGRSRVLAGQVPVFAAVSSPRGAETSHPAPAALRVYPSLSDRCPSERVRQLAARGVLDPAHLPMDRGFYLYLVEYRGEDEPLACLARASIAIFPNRAWAARTNVHVGILGNTQLVLAGPAPLALLVSVPLGYASARVPFPRFFPLQAQLDLAVSFTGGVALDDFGVNRFGPALTLAAVAGITAAPRLFVLGVGLNVFVFSSYVHLPVYAFAGIDLVSFYDLVGGR